VFCSAVGLGVMLGVARLGLNRLLHRLLMYQRYAMLFTLRITLAPQASRAALDIARAEADFASEASMMHGSKWDAGMSSTSLSVFL